MTTSNARAIAKVIKRNDFILREDGLMQWADDENKDNWFDPRELDDFDQVGYDEELARIDDMLKPRKVTAASLVNGVLTATIDGETKEIEQDLDNADFRAVKQAEFRNDIVVSVEDIPAGETNPYPNLTPRQFEWMLGYYSLDDIWDGVVAEAKANKQDPNALALFANLSASSKAGTYILDDTLMLMQQVRDKPQIVNSGIDLSDEAIKRYWRHAAVQDFASLTQVTPEPTPPVGE